MRDIIFCTFGTDFARPISSPFQVQCLLALIRPHPVYRSEDMIFFSSDLFSSKCENQVFQNGDLDL